MTQHLNNPSSRIVDVLTPYALPLLITLCVTLVLAFGSALSDWLRFDRNAIIGGEIWRVITGHLAHLGWRHWLMNVAGLWLIWLLVGPQFSFPMWGVITITGMLGTSLGLLLFNPELLWYVGLSGLLHTMVVSGCLSSLRHSRIDAGVLLALIIAKLVWEQFSGPLPGSEISAGGNVIVDAHLYGAVVGGVLVIPLLFINKKQS